MKQLVRINPEKRMHRYYSVRIQTTLFEPHAVVIEWGSLRTNYRRVRIVPAESLSAAEILAQSIIHKKQQRGYKPRNI